MLHLQPRPLPATALVSRPPGAASQAPSQPPQRPTSPPCTHLHETLVDLGNGKAGGGDAHHADGQREEAKVRGATHLARARRGRLLGCRRRRALGCRLGALDEVLGGRTATEGWKGSDGRRTGEQRWLPVLPTVPRLIPTPSHLDLRLHQLHARLRRLWCAQDKRRGCQTRSRPLQGRLLLLLSACYEGRGGRAGITTGASSESS